MRLNDITERTYLNWAPPPGTSFLEGFMERAVWLSFDVSGAEKE
jgi:hypothetical protein